MSFLNAERVNVTLLAILETIFPPRESEVMVREATRDAVARLMKPQSIHLADDVTSTSSFSVTALLPYRSEFIQSLILEAKFHTNVRAHALLGEIVALYIKNLNLSTKDVVIIPLPLGTKRRKSRGYNQVEEIAKYACRYIGASLRTDILVRVRETVPQMSLGREASSGICAAPSVPRIFLPHPIPLSPTSSSMTWSPPVRRSQLDTKDSLRPARGTLCCSHWRIRPKVIICMDWRRG